MEFFVYDKSKYLQGITSQSPFRLREYPRRIPPARGQTKKPGWWFNMPMDAEGTGGGGGRGGGGGGGRGVGPTGVGSDTGVPTQQGGSYGQRGGGSVTVGARDRNAPEQRQERVQEKGGLGLGKVL